MGGRGGIIRCVAVDWCSKGMADWLLGWIELLVICVVVGCGMGGVE
jgi:hypothetical protein